MKRLLLFVFLFFICSARICLAQEKIIKYKSFNGILSNNSRTFKQLKNLFKEELKDLKVINFKSIKKVREINLNKSKLSIYEISLKEEGVPSIIPCQFSLLKIDNYIAILWLEDIKIIKMGKEGNFIGGIYKIKSKGFFAVYAISENYYKLVFDSKDEKKCPNGIAVYNNSLDCISYSPFLWHFRQKDYNHDGCIDFSFSGNINYYCKGLELGLGRDNEKPKKIRKVKLIFLFDKTQKKWYLSPSVDCEKIN